MSNRVSRTDATADLIRLLDHADEHPGAADLRTASFDLLRLQKDSVAVDVGCGSGRAAAEMASRAARVLAFDADEHMVQVARERWPDLDVRRGYSEDLPLTDGSVTAYRADKVLHEMARPERAISEARRVLAPGGRIVLIGQDWDGILIDADDPAVARAIVHARADLVKSPRAARQFRNLMLDAGFAEVEVEGRLGTFTDETMLAMVLGMARAAADAGGVGQDEAARFVQDQRGRARTGRFFVAMPLLIGSATRPSDHDSVRGGVQCGSRG